MGRGTAIAKAAYVRVNRGLERVLPADLLWYAILPVPLVQGLRRARRDPRMPPDRLPPDPERYRPSLLRRWRYQTGVYARWRMFDWPWRLGGQKWLSRTDAVGAERLLDLAATRGVVGATLHSTGIVSLGVWLRSRGLATGSIVLQERWQTVKRGDNGIGLGRGPMGRTLAFAPGTGRHMVDFLRRPGSVLVIPVDHPRGHVLMGRWPGGQVRMSTGALRLARLSGAAVVPMVVTEHGRWRHRVHIGSPVPDAIVRDGDEQAMADHVAAELMPILAADPKQAMDVLWTALMPRDPREGSTAPERRIHRARVRPRPPAPPVPAAGSPPAGSPRPGPDPA